MVNKMVKATTLMLDTWEQKVRNARGSTQLEINNSMRTITTTQPLATTTRRDNKCFNKWKPLFKLLLKLSQIVFFSYLDLGLFLFLFPFMKMQDFTLSHVCMFQWTSNWPTTRYIMVSNTILKIIILHMVNDKYMLFIMEKTHMFVWHLVKMY